MREVKFRMFDTLDKEFMNGSRVLESRISDLNKEGRFIYQQWTGLKDKNGKDIYISDLVKNQDGNIYEVIINDFMQIPVIDSELGQGALFNHHYQCEVIGNIYENPELLK